MECCERFAVLGFNLAWPSLLLCCLKDKSSPLFIFSCFKKQPVRQAGLGRLRGSLSFDILISVWSELGLDLSLSETLRASFFRPQLSSPRLNLLAMKPNQRVIYKSYSSQLKFRDWDYGGGGERRVWERQLWWLQWFDLCQQSSDWGRSHHHSYHSDHQWCPATEEHQMTAFWLMSSDEWINRSVCWLEECVNWVTFNLLDKYFQQQGNH